MYLTAKEARARIGVSRATFEKLAKSGALKASKVGTSRNSPYRVKVTDLDEYMERQVVRAAQ